MKTLIDIQQEVRQLERSLQMVSGQIIAIDSQLSELQKSESDVVDSIDIKTIKRGAKSIPFTFHLIKTIKDEELRRVYLIVLVSLIQYENESMEDMLTIVQWMLSKSGLKIELLDLLKMSYKYNTTHLKVLTEKLTKDMQASLVVDMLILWNLSSRTSHEGLGYIAEMASLLEITKKELKDYSIIAKCVLEQSVSKLTKKEKIAMDKMLKRYKHYFTVDMLGGMRSIAVSQADKSDITFKWKVKQLATVVQGDLIAEVITTPSVITTWHRKSGQKSTRKIVTPISGTIYQFRNSGINYGVISTKEDNKDSIKEWIKKTKGKSK